MTNGEKIINTFHGKVSKNDGIVYFSTDGWIYAYADEWWNAEYKEPTTKNNLGVDCISRADARHLIAESFRKNLLGMTFNKMFKTLYEGIDNLPSVTPQEPKTVEAIPRADYENRLKADLAAMLTDFLMDIEENTSINSNDSHEKNGKRLMRTEIIGMFEQKINSLKEQT